METDPKRGGRGWGRPRRRVLYTKLSWHTLIPKVPSNATAGGQRPPACRPKLSGFISIWQQTSGPDDRGHAAPGTGGRPGTCWAGDPAFSHNRHVKGLEPGSRALQTSQSERGNRLLQAGGGRRSWRKWAERWAGDVGMMAEPAPNRPIPTVSGKWPPPARPGREQDRATLESCPGTSRRAIGSPASQRLAPLAIVEKGPLVCSCRLSPSHLHRSAA